MPVVEVVTTFRAAPFRWWITGGHALEVHTGRRWRAHDDSDVGIVRDDAARLRAHLSDWSLFVAAGGRVQPWSGEELRADLGHNNLWCRRVANGPFVLDIAIGAGDDDEWIYRRDPSFRLPWAKAVLLSADGVPYLAPELQLLFKSKNHRPKDDTDAREVIPDLEPDRRDRLAALLPAGHSWHELLSL